MQRIGTGTLGRPGQEAPLRGGEGRGGAGRGKAGVERLPRQGPRAAGTALAPHCGQDAHLRGNQGLLGHLANHVVEDAPVVEISELHVGIKPHDSLEGLAGMQLGGRRSREESLREEASQPFPEASCPARPQAAPPSVVHTPAVPATGARWPQPRPAEQ